ncbi:MAG: PAS domain-containing protein [Candidatus Hydrothermarchaeaceae archaeon]
MASTSDESILDSIEESILIIDRDFNILNANSCLLRSLNLKKQDVIGKSCYRVVHCDPPDETCPFQELLKTGKSSTKRRTCPDENGNEVCTEVTVYPLVEGENTNKFIHIERDITERVKVEKEVEEHIANLSKKIR